jgi:hypothetical protein
VADGSVYCRAVLIVVEQLILTGVDSEQRSSEVPIGDFSFNVFLVQPETVAILLNFPEVVDGADIPIGGVHHLLLRIKAADHRDPLFVALVVGFEFENLHDPD